MKLFFHAQPGDSKVAKEKVQQIFETLRRTAFEVSSSLFKKEGEADLNWETGIAVLAQFDCFILEITNPDQQISYFLAQAILMKKPVLCLYQKNNPPRSLLMFLKQKHIPKFIQIKGYLENTLANILANFLGSISDNVGDLETPTIRFTLRLTPHLDKYLSFAVRGKKITKADYLREMIKKQMDSDQEFLKKT